MKLIGNLKKQVETSATKDEAREAIRNAGMELTDDELDMVAGGESNDMIKICLCGKKWDISTRNGRNEYVNHMRGCVVTPQNH